MKRRSFPKPAHKGPLAAPCCVLSAVLFAGSLAEAAIRWDAMASPVRIVFRLIGTGRLSAAEIFEAVRPEIENGALVYPLCVLVCALCGLWGLGTVLFRRRGFAAAAMYLCAGVLTLLSAGGTALKNIHLVRCVLTAAAAFLFALRAFLPRRAAAKCEAAPGNTDRRQSAARRQGEGGGDPSPRGGGRLFDMKRRPLFGDDGERRPLFDHGKDKNGRR